MIYSTDMDRKSFSVQAVVREDSVTFGWTSRFGYRGGLRLSVGLARKTRYTSAVTLAFDKEKNEILIIPDANGNYCVGKGFDGERTEMWIPKFLLFCGFTQETFPKGRFRAYVDDEYRTHILLNEPLALIRKGRGRGKN